jgi:tetratricopeptide (TPR) repeat protein
MLYAALSLDDAAAIISRSRKIIRSKEEGRDSEIMNQAATKQQLENLVDGGDVEAMVVLGQSILQDSKDRSRAAELFRRATTLQPEYGEAWVNLGRCLLHTSPKEALSALEVAEKLGHTDSYQPLADITDSESDDYMPRQLRAAAKGSIKAANVLGWAYTKLFYNDLFLVAEESKTLNLFKKVKRLLGLEDHTASAWRNREMARHWFTICVNSGAATQLEPLAILCRKAGDISLGRKYLSWIVDADPKRNDIKSLLNSWDDENKDIDVQFVTKRS